MRKTVSPKSKSQPTTTANGGTPLNGKNTTYLSTASTAITVGIESAVGAQGGATEDYVFFVNRVVRHGDDGKRRIYGLYLE
jgi:hypothetical protein